LSVSLPSALASGRIAELADQLADVIGARRADVAGHHQRRRDRNDADRGARDPRHT
jgi:hypothetical protein